MNRFPELTGNSLYKTVFRLWKTVTKVLDSEFIFCGRWKDEFDISHVNENMMKGENESMKKKFISVLAALMVLSFGTTVFAANSPVAGDVQESVTENTSQTEVEKVTADKSAEEYVSAVGEVTTADGTKATVSAAEETTINNAVATVNEQLKDVVNIANKYIAGTKGEALAKAAMDSSKKITTEVKSIVNVTVAGVSASNPVTLTFNVAGVTADSCILLLHYNETTGKWENIPATTGNGTVTATFTSLSPIAIVELKADTAAVSNSDDDDDDDDEEETTATSAAPASETAAVNPAPAENANAEAISPKTGSEMPAAVVIAVICAAGAVVCTRKMRVNK